MGSLLIDAGIASSIAFFLTFFLIPALCWMSRKYKFVDIPDGVIKMHEQPIPNLGGLAVYVGFVAAFFLSTPVIHSAWLHSLFLGVTLLLIIGLADDRVRFAPAQKFFWQFLVGLFFLKTGFYLKDSPFYSFIAQSLSLLWMLTIVNAFNLIDIMDGLATTVAIGISFTLLVFAFFIGSQLLVLLLAAFLGSLLAFLWYNKPAATVYLGDAGALFIGGFLAVVSFLFPWDSYYNAYGFIVVPFIFFIPLCELISLIVIRTYKKIPFYLPSPDHFCMYLLRKGWSKNKILGYVFSINLIILCIAVLFSLQSLSLFKFSLLSLLVPSLWAYFLTTRTA